MTTAEEAKMIYAIVKTIYTLLQRSLKISELQPGYVKWRHIAGCRPW